MPFFVLSLVRDNIFCERDLSPVGVHKFPREVVRYKKDDGWSFAALHMHYVTLIFHIIIHVRNLVLLPRGGTTGSRD